MKFFPKLEAIVEHVSSWPHEAIIAGGFGAFFGALGAQVIASRFQATQRAKDEINGIATAQMLCFSICNIFLALKRQHIRPMDEHYSAVQAEYENFANAPADGQPRIFEFEADLRTLAPPRTAVAILENAVLEKVSIRNRPLAAALQLI